MAVFYLSTNLLINELVVEADLCRILSVVGIIDSVEVRPIDGTQAHRTRFARGINLAPLQVECLQGTSCLTNGIHLGMGGRVVVDGDAIGSLSLFSERAMALRINSSFVIFLFPFYLLNESHI